MLLVGPARYSGYQLSPRVGKVLAGANGLNNRHPSAGLALLHQFQGAHAVPGVARQHVHRGDQLGVGVHHHGRLVSVKPMPTALVAMAQLRIMYRHHPVLAHPVPDAHLAVSVITTTITNAVRTALHVLEQQLPQQFRRFNYGCLS